MTARAYVLIDVEAGKAKDVAEIIRGKTGICAADIVTGPHDIIAVVEGPDAEAVAGVVLNEISLIEGVTHTMTCLVMEAK